MRAFVASLTAILVIAIVAWVLGGVANRPSGEASVTDRGNVRLR